MKKIVIVAMAYAIILSGCAKDQSSNPEKILRENVSESTDSKATLLLSETQNQGVVVYGIQDKTQRDIFSSLIVHINGTSKTFAWNNVTNPSFYPEIILSNLDTEAEDEIVLILTKGEGTGVRQSEVHVLRKDFTEIPVVDPIEAVMSKITFDLKTDKYLRKYTVSIEGKKNSSEFKESDSSGWFAQPTVGNIVRYSIEGKVLIAEMPIQISVGNYLGNATVKYDLLNGMLEATKFDIQEEGSTS